MWYFVKNFLFGFIYVIFMGLVPYGIETIDGQTIRILLNIVNILVYFLIMGVSMFKEGEKARELLTTNNTERKRILQTGELRPIKRAPEYRPWKGFLMGGIISAPLILFLAIHALIALFGGTYEMFGVVAVTFYMGFFMPYILLKYGGMLNEQILFKEYFICLYAVPVIVLLYGIMYIIGAKKVEKRYAFIEARVKAGKGEN